MKRPSTAIRSTSYDSMTRTLDVVYASDVTYQYHGVPSHVAAALNRAESKGAFLVKYIKGKYKAVKVGENDK